MGRGRYDYRSYDYGRGRREAMMITGWFRGNRGLTISLNSRSWRRDGYDFRRGLYLSPVVEARLDLLPFDLELQLGPLPFGYERRLYGHTVLVIDMRRQLIVDVYDIDW